jgi:hypothetical protein
MNKAANGCHSATLTSLQHGPTTSGLLGAAAGHPGPTALQAHDVINNNNRLAGKDMF